MDAASCLKDLLAVAPAVSKPRAKIGLFGLIWGLGTGIWSWRKNRQYAGKLIDPIITNRCNFVIDMEIVKHNNEYDLVKQWTQIRSEFRM